MRTVRLVAELRAALAGPRRDGARIGLVPTMGAFHAGHLALIRRARSECDLVVVSLFVNPTQFDDAGDLDAYPRDERRDGALAAENGVDLLFAPPAEEVYPAGHATRVTVGGITETLEGARRGRAHFDGVATVVTKLLNMVGPEVAYFGQKDAQQVAVVRRLVADLNLPVRIEAVPTVREPDGLAMSSRNVRLSPADRAAAVSLHRALRTAAEAIAAGAATAAEVRARALAALDPAAVPEYFELVGSDTLAPLQRIEPGHPVLAVIAARVGAVRLIDNLPIDPIDPVAAVAAVAAVASHTARPFLASAPTPERT